MKDLEKLSKERNNNSSNRTINIRPTSRKHKKKLTGEQELYFYDAAAPIIEKESI